MGLPKSCPHCKSNLEGEDIYENLLREYGNKQTALEHAELFGWSPENPVKFSRVIGIYDMEEDMTMHWQCPDCKKIIE